MVSAADLSEDSSAPVPYLAPDLDSVKLYNIAEELSDTRATSYTTTDIYNLLNSIRVTASGQYKFNVQDTTTHNYVLTLRNHIDDIFGYNTAYNFHDMMKDIWSRVGGNSSSSANIVDLILNLNQNLIYTIGDETYSVGELLYNLYISNNQINNKLTTVNNNLSDINTNLSDIATNISIISSNISYLADDINNITWLPANCTYLGASTDYNTSFITSNTNGSNFKFAFNINTSNNSNNPSIYRIFIPYERSVGIVTSNDFELKAIKRKSGSNYVNLTFDNTNVFYESTYKGLYIYLLDFSNFTTADYYFEVQNNTTYTSIAKPTPQGDISYITFDTLDYHVMKSSFYNKKNASGSDALKRLSDVYASDDLIQAKQNQQAYEDEVVADFTGSGSGASTTSDKNGLKSVSGNIKSGLNTGGSINNALGVFNTNNSLWQFFTSTTQNNVDTRNSSNTRSINLRDSNDSILDFQSERDREYYSHLGE